MTEGASGSPRGSLWNRWDLHCHTPSSYDYEDKSLSNDIIVESLIAAGTRVVAVTDHHTIDVARIAKLQQLGADKLTVLPGIELRSDHGGEPVHYICIFPEFCDLGEIWTRFQGTLGLTAAGIKGKGGQEKVYVPIKDAHKITCELGGIISIHAGGKSNSIEGISNKEQFQQRIKYDLTKQYVDIMEIGQLKDIEVHLKTIFPATGLDKPLVLCSDNHRATAYSVNAPTWFRADPTFRGMLMVLREPRGRVFIGDTPPDLIRAKSSPTKIIRQVGFNRAAGAPANNQWFTGVVPLNSGLVAIIGNKGSGKSALADTLGLLGATKNADTFSFLSDKRFRHPTSGFARHFEATIEWASGETATRTLADHILPNEVERIKYLPQDYVEAVCNEVAEPGEVRFEQELKAVIFSHVPNAERLGHKTLDDLVRFHTGEKQKRIDSLLRQLRELSRKRAVLALQGNPAVRHELMERIKARRLELALHLEGKPTEVPEPNSAGGLAPADGAILDSLANLALTREGIVGEVDQARGERSAAERRYAVAMRLLEKMHNFKKDYELFLTALAEDASELGVDLASLVAVSLTPGQVELIRDQEAALIARTKTALSESDPGSLLQRLADLEASKDALQATLDAPQRAHQIYVKELEEWRAKESELIGNDQAPDSIEGLEASVAALADLPSAIARATSDQLEVALQIHEQKVAQAVVYRELYGSVQRFIDAHGLAKDKLQLDFRAELTNEGVGPRLFAHLALNRKGSFLGLDEGLARMASLVEPVVWEDALAVQGFLTQVDEALHVDKRPGHGETVQLKDQLVKGKKPEEVFDLLYGLEYVGPRYVLRWEDKDLSMLSAGERGALLLVFYLLIDKGDIPLLIDQPEGNLDNQTVAKVLVECIKEARNRRQVFIVTHNPNLAVVCDADQVIYASIDKTAGNVVTYESGALENPAITKYVTDVLEGTRWAFGVRDSKYKVGE